jgi:hypothetical protein
MQEQAATIQGMASQIEHYQKRMAEIEAEKVALQTNTPQAIGARTTIITTNPAMALPAPPPPPRPPMPPRIDPNNRNDDQRRNYGRYKTSRRGRR